VFGFGDIKVDGSAKELAERTGVTIATSKIIYKLSEWLAEELEKRRPRVESEEKTGTAKINRLFGGTKHAQIIGAKVQEGVITIGDDVKVLRRDFEIGRGKIVELQQQKVKAKQVLEGFEFGAKVETKIEIAQGDVIESYVTVKK